MSASQPKLLSVSVDLDGINDHAQIHGLPLFQAEDERVHIAYDRAVPRITAWAADLGLPLSLFVIGRDLTRQRNVNHLREAHRRGHAIECHSLSHRYNLVRLEKPLLEREVFGGMDAIFGAVGERPQGFRAPGYIVSDALFDTLEEARVAFDSSVFSSPFYYGAKALVLATMPFRSRTSVSIVDHPSVLLAPRDPYRPARNYRVKAGRGAGRSLIELPIMVSPILGLPIIGTAVGAAPLAIVRLLARMCTQRSFMNLELHAMDFLDADDVAPHPLTRAQPELHTPLAVRLDRLTEFVKIAQKAGFASVTLAEAAKRYASFL
ncbi:MAG: polysaccharide deacetylase family protein [Polyangiaceae bacterium]|nr:polysaccharide deacetylase family protein [Polyangiaceae bacterium]